MKKSLVICFLFAFLFVQNINSQTLGELYTEKTAGFSMSMPLGWQTFDASQKYLMIIGPTDSGITPNIGFADEAYSGSITAYIDLVLLNIRQLFNELNVIDRYFISTNAGLQGECVTFQGRMGEINVRQKMYVFPNVSGNEIMQIVTTASAINGEKFDPLFDECIKTFRWTR